MIKINLNRNFFTYEPQVVAVQNDLEVTIKKYKSQIESLVISNSKGYVEVLPYMGQIIWDLNFKNKSLKLHNIFDTPKKANTIIDTYGCFAFHSGLLANGCPSKDDTHVMHGEFAVKEMDDAYLLIEDDAISIVSEINYCQGFGYHYKALASVRLASNETFIKITQDVTNLTCIDMPLQYMCHINYCYEDMAKISSNIPDEAFKLRESIPSHVHPTEKWLAYNEKLKELQKQNKTLSVLDEPQMYDPEIVFLADNIDKYSDVAEFTMQLQNDIKCFTKFRTKDFPFVTRWIMKNDDLQVAAFALPATCRPEGFLAAKKANTLIYLKRNENKKFEVITGIKED